MATLSDIDINALQPNGHKSSLPLDSDEDEDYDTAVGLKPQKMKNSLYMEDSNEEEYLSPLEHDNGKNKNEYSSRSSIKKELFSNGTHPKKIPIARKRRRSSARFLRLSGRFAQEDDVAAEEDQTQEEEQEKLGEMYRQAIRLNAANKINAGNSWGLRLIENIDKFLGDDEDDCDSTTMKTKGETEDAQNGGVECENERRVNFTKASCTLDASVKIYSFRVDDVHLTSYKVLANLNRSDEGKKAENDKNDRDLISEENESQQWQSTANEMKKSGKNLFVNTIESNHAHLNISKLDAAYDIDPLFHKMSQKFDEGGAKGLLLVNLGVASDGCRIVLDSKEDSIADDTSAVVTVDAEDNTQNACDEKNSEVDNSSSAREEGLIDISSLRTKLQELLLYSPIESIQLVPQISDLREKYAELEANGFTDVTNASELKSKRYANSEEDEKAAEEVIHREAVERSRASMGMTLSVCNISSTAYSYTTPPTDEGNISNFVSDEYHDGIDDDNDENENLAFNDFVSMDENAVRYSSSTFPKNNCSQDEFVSSALTKESSTIPFLDSICSGEALNRRCSEFDYFNTAALEKITSGNQWAGSAHWKKSLRVYKKMTEDGCKTPKDRKLKTKLKEKLRTFVDLSSPSCQNHSLVKNTKTKSGRRSHQLTAAMKQKHLKDFNVLPSDARIGIKALSALFMRPKDSFTKKLNNDVSISARKSVGFAAIDTFLSSPYDDGIDDSHHDDPGFQSSEECNESNYFENDDYIVRDLDNVRKVDKIVVKHATIAKKIDVKRLKKDLWDEVEAKSTFVVREERSCKNNERTDDKSGGTNMSTQGECSGATLSFQDTVENLKCFQKQEDVSLPFYFICMLHLANEKQLRLENVESGLNDFIIYRDNGTEPTID